MITFLTKSMRDNPLYVFLRDWAGPLRERVRTLSYPDLATLRHVEPGAYLFTGTDELVGGERELAAQFAARLESAGGVGAGFRVLNDPRRALGRHPLMKALHEQGINRFRAFRIDEVPDDCRYPVFVRRENAHTGSLSTLVPDREQLRRTIRRLLLTPRRYRARDLLVTEFMDTHPPDGLYRKFGAMRVGDRIIPRHLLFSGNWITKYADEYSDQFHAEETEYLSAFPQEAEIRHVFEIAGIDYGRIDFGMVDGKVQVWEINTNPTMAVRLEKIHPLRVDLQKRSMEQILAAFDALDAGLTGEPIAEPMASSSRVLRFTVRTRDAVRRLAVKAYRKAGLRLRG